MLFQKQEEFLTWVDEHLGQASRDYDTAFEQYKDPAKAYDRWRFLEVMKNAAARMGVIHGGATGVGKGAAAMAAAIARGQETKRPILYITTAPLVGNVVAELLERGADEPRLKLHARQIVPIMGSPKDKLRALQRVRALSGSSFTFVIANPEALLPPNTGVAKATNLARRLISQGVVDVRLLPGIPRDEEPDLSEPVDYEDTVQVQQRSYDTLMSIWFSAYVADEFPNWLASTTNRVYGEIFGHLKADWRIGLSATSFPYKPDQFVNAVQVFQPGRHFVSAAQFKRDHFSMEGDRVKHTYPGWEATWDKFKKDLIFTCDLDEVVELPPIKIVHHKVQMPDEQRAAYDKLVTHMKIELMNGLRQGVEVDMPNILVQIMRLKQAATDLRLLQKAAAKKTTNQDWARGLSWTRKQGATSAKLDVIVHQFMHELNKWERGVVYSQWSEMVMLVVDDFLKNGVRADFLTGEVSSHITMVPEKNAVWSPRLAKCKEFCYGATEVMVINDAASEGANLQRANHIWILDLPWRPDKIWQAIGRVRRPIPDKMLPLIGGKPLPVTVHVMVAAGTIEETLLLPRMARSARAAGMFTRGKDLMDERTGGLFTGADLEVMSLHDREALLSIL